MNPLSRSHLNRKSKLRWVALKVLRKCKSIIEHIFHMIDTGVLIGRPRESDQPLLINQILR
jgi:hypothetical protein